MQAHQSAPKSKSAKELKKIDMKEKRDFEKKERDRIKLKRKMAKEMLGRVADGISDGDDVSSGNEEGQKPKKNEPRLSQIPYDNVDKTTVPADEDFSENEQPLMKKTALKTNPKLKVDQTKTSTPARGVQVTMVSDYFTKA